MTTSFESNANSQSMRPPAISVIVPVSERPGPARTLHVQYREVLDSIGISYEMLYVLDGRFEDFEAQLLQLRQEGEKLSIVRLGKHFGEAAALEAGREASCADWILTLPAYFQIDIKELPNILADYDEWDMSVGCRSPRIDSRINQFLSRIFHSLVNRMTGSHFHDLGNGVRLIRRKVMDDVPLYGDQHRFLPLLAERRGYRVREVELLQSVDEDFRRLPKIGVIPRRMLDLLTVFFLIKFTKKPLRFFGLLGAGFSALGVLWTLILIGERFFFDQPLGERPALLMAALLIILGVQVFAMGLIGEIIIYVHARRIPEYTIEKIIN